MVGDWGLDEKTTQGSKYMNEEKGIIWQERAGRLG